MAHVREAMLRAAAGVLAHRGLEGTTMQHIAEEAGYTVPSLYAYFKGRQDLIDALLTRLDELTERTFTDSMPAGLSFPQKLELLVHRQLQFGEEWRAAFLVSNAAKQALPAEETTRKASRPMAGYEEWTIAWLKRHSRPEDLGEYSPELFSCVLRGILSAVFDRWLKTATPVHIPDLSPVVVGVVLHGIAGTTPATEGEAGSSEALG